MTNILVAILITTNLVFHPCSGGTPGGKCQWCHYETNGFGHVLATTVPEHVNQLGYDCDYVVTTQYLPVVEITNATIVESRPFNYVSAPVLNDTLIPFSTPDNP